MSHLRLAASVTRAARALAVFVVVAACGGDDAPAGPEGAYQLASVNGQALPATFQTSATTNQTYENGTLRLEPGGRYELTYRLTSRGTVVLTSAFTDVGTWTRTPTGLRLTVTQSGQPFDATVAGDAVTVQRFTYAMRFQR